MRRPPGVFELTWDDNGRATWQYGPETSPRRAAHHLAPHRHALGMHSILTES
ncbi:hypothetical protein ACF1BP_33490 [Streptomyces sp. NPDC014735]|uniref:hypothetical protein n=1 Tax=unclassified Streptomyces TaxID=2593676 RepID=UPI0036F5EA96